MILINYWKNELKITKLPSLIDAMLYVDKPLKLASVISLYLLRICNFDFLTC